MLVFSLAIPVHAAENNQNGNLQPQAAKQVPQAIKPIPAVKMTPPAAPKAPDVRPGQPPQTQVQQNQQMNQQLKMWEERKQQEKAREKMLKDAKTVQAAPAKGKTATTGKSAQNNSLNRTAIDPGR
jgi:hypothetical protein